MVRTSRVADTLLDAGLVVLATWTLVYHVSLLVGLPSTPALVVEAVLLLVAVALWRRSRVRAGSPPDLVAGRDAETLETGGDTFGGRSRSAPGSRPRSVRLVAGTSTGATVVAAGGMALAAPWTVVWISWAVAVVAGCVLAWWRVGRGPSRIRHTGDAGDDDAGPETDRGGNRSRGTVAALLWAVALAALSTTILRPNPDDLFYVNLSQWVATHGTFPLRDTLFSDLVYPMANWPPMASYDTATGAVAHVAGVPAGDVVYVLVPPVATFLSVLALWRLLRVWEVRSVAVALTLALGFLLADGSGSYASPGNLFLTRLWQGKVILLCLVVPLLLVHALRYVRRPTAARAGWLALGGVAAVGLSTTAMFLVPLVAVAGTAPLLCRAPARALAGAAAMGAYPVLAGAATLVLGGRSADDFGARRLYRFDPAWFGPQVFLTGVVAAVGVAAVLLGPRLVPRPDGAMGAGVAAGFVGLTFVPGVTVLSYELTGLGPTLWRVTWGCTIAALVGVAGSRLLDLALDRLPGRAPGAGPHRRGLLAATAACTAVVALVGVGHPIWADEARSRFVAAPHWQRGEETRGVTAWLVRRTRPGDRVLVPEGLGVTVAATTTEVKTVAPRTYAMSYLSGVAAFDHPERLLLQDLVNRLRRPSSAEVRVALRDLAVRVACVDADDEQGAATLRAAGMFPALRTTSYRCLSASATLR